MHSLTEETGHKWPELDPTGGLREALKESLGEGVSTLSSPIVGSKMTPGASEVSPYMRKTIGYWFVRSCPPLKAFPVVVAFLVVGTTKGLILIGPETLRVFRGALLSRKSSPSFTS